MSRHRRLFLSSLPEPGAATTGSSSLPHPETAPRSKISGDAVPSSLAVQQPRSPLLYQWIHDQKLRPLYLSFGPPLLSPSWACRGAKGTDWDILAHDSTVYKTRTKAGRKRKEKKVASSIASSCPPILRTQSLEGNLNLESCIDYLPKEYSVPNQPAKKERLIRMPEDFIKEQKRYFEEVDAFELPEEDVSDSDLTWISGQARVHDKKGSPRKIPADP